MKKYLFVGFVLGICLLSSFFAILTMGGGQMPMSATSVVGSPTYKGTVAISTTGDFEGRKTLAHQGIDELVQIDHNVLYNFGANMTRDCLISGGCGVISNISLCNATATCDSPIAAGTDVNATEIFTSCGLAPMAGTVSILQGYNGNWTVAKTFTASCDDVQTNVTRLANNSAKYFAGNTFALVTMQTNDQLTVNWTLQVS